MEMFLCEAARTGFNCGIPFPCPSGQGVERSRGKRMEGKVITKLDDRHFVRDSEIEQRIRSEGRRSMRGDCPAECEGTQAQLHDAMTGALNAS